MSATFYSGTTRKAIVTFGAMFNDMHIFRKDDDEKIIQKIAVPLTYAPKHKFLARLYQEPDIESKPYENTLPRMSFEIESFGYDRGRKLNSNTNNVAIVDNQYRSMKNGVPYNLTVALYIYSKNMEDALQVVEQILPQFPPTKSLEVKILPEMGIIQAIPVTLNNVEYVDNYEGDYSTHRTIIYTLTFTMQVNYFAGIEGYDEDICGLNTGDAKGLIRHVDVGIYDGSTGVKKVNISETLNPFMANETDFYKIDEEIKEYDQ